MPTMEDNIIANGRKGIAPTISANRMKYCQSFPVVSGETSDQDANQSGNDNGNGSDGASSAGHRTQAW
ncbi:MAG: hypothetical protein ACLR23_17975 [Clostridia bacterium]